jgi:predicted ATP-grasp superfamily ATP-dependent carboligase
MDADPVYTAATYTSNDSSAGSNVPNFTKLTNFATALEAEMFVEQLKSVGITAVSRGVDITGIFGPGFQGATARGVDVLVAAGQLDEAREILADYRAD